MRVERPTVLGSLNGSWAPGLRRSASTSSTRLSACAMTMARFAAVTVLPSLGTALVSSSVRIGLSTDAKSTPVRSARYASATPERG